MAAGNFTSTFRIFYARSCLVSLTSGRTLSTPFLIPSFFFIVNGFRAFFRGVEYHIRDCSYEKIFDCFSTATAERVSSAVPACSRRIIIATEDDTRWERFSSSSLLVTLRSLTIDSFADVDLRLLPLTWGNLTEIKGLTLQSGGSSVPAIAALQLPLIVLDWNASAFVDGGSVFDLLTLRQLVSLEVRGRSWSALHTLRARSGFSVQLFPAVAWLKPGLGNLEAICAFLRDMALSSCKCASPSKTTCSVTKSRASKNQ
ncbi:hypothetical protein B0H16DRAFT_1772662 [Mycena metata]|uniref:Uncharacterized protein n=1 Tax=Mycena metata TaxID=1033252 RepID=A0AAD7HZI4_9AGAR|nr:hypothetical protein B0H16DRAFT_1772662 [Mycena metata]